MRNGDYILMIAPEDYPGKRYRGRYCYEHHVNYWRANGILPRTGEIVQHVDEDRHNNEPYNLVLMSIAEHNAEHNAGKMKPLVHGTYHGYARWKCRCVLCKNKRAADSKKYRAARRERTGRDR